MTDTELSHDISHSSVQSWSSGQNFWQWDQTPSSSQTSLSSNQASWSDSIAIDANSFWSAQATINIEQLAPASYVPSELERKRAVMMYFLVGIVISIQSKSIVSDYERFHLQQSLGRRAIFSVFIFFLVVYVVIFVFVRRGFLTLPWLILLIYLSLWGYFVYQAWKWNDVLSPNTKIVLPVFWYRILVIRSFWDI